MPQEWTAEVVAQLHLHKLTIKQLAEEAGYEDLATTQIYAKMNKEVIKHQYEKFVN